MRLLKTTAAVLLFSLAAFLISACSRNEQAAAATAVAYTQAALEGNVEEVFNQLYINPSDRAAMQGKLTTLIKAAAADTKLRGGLTRIESTGVEFLNDDHTAAIVKVDYAFKNGDSKQDQVKVIKVGDSWKVPI